MRLSVGLAGVILTLLAVVWTQQRRLIYFPFGQVPDLQASGLDGVTAVTFPTADGLELNGWFIRPTPTPRLTVIVFNGNAGNRAFRAPLARALAHEGLAVLLFDYRGYGGNPGSPTEEGLRIDARAARSYVVSRAGVNPKHVVYFGESLGSAVAAELAVEHAPEALILRSPFTSMADIGQFHYRFLPVRWLLRDRFSTIDPIARIHTRLLVIAGDRDRIVPVDQSRRVYEAANDPKSLLIIANADHNDAALLAGSDMTEAILRFLAAT